MKVAIPENTFCKELTKGHNSKKNLAFPSSFLMGR